MAYAQTQTGWGLPNVKELSCITDKIRINPAIDVTAFPATPLNLYWSASPYAGYAAFAWFVYFGNGNVGSNGRGYDYLVRLVLLWMVVVWRVPVSAWGAQRLGKLLKSRVALP